MEQSGLEINLNRRGSYMIEILFFAHLTEKAGGSKFVEKAEGMSVAELKVKYFEKMNISPEGSAILIAVNEAYATDETILKSGDVVAFIPPVSGG